MQVSTQAVTEPTAHHANTKRHLLWLFLWATLIALPLLLHPSFPSAPDIETHIYNTYLFGQELADGVLYPRWLGDLYWGYGSPSGMLSKVLTYYTAGLLTNLGLSPVVALKAILWGTLLGAGWFMYRFAREFLSTRGALTAALIYQAAPYAMIDLYSRASLPEYMAFLWLPALLLLLVWCVERRSLAYPALFALCYTALMLTHFLVAYLMGIALVLFALCLLWRATQPRREVILRLALAAILTGAIAAFYLLPVLAENSYLNVRWFVEGNPWGDYRNNFLLNAQAYIGTNAEYLYLENTLISVGALLSLVLALALLALNVRYRGSRPARQRGMSFILLFIFFVSTLMAFTVAQPLYNIIPRLDLLQFPWRWQSISAVAMAYLAGDALSWFWHNRRRVRRILDKLIAQVMMSAMILHIFYGGFLVIATLLVRDPIPEQNLQEVLGQRPIEASYMYRTFLPIWAAEVDFGQLQANPRLTSDPPADIVIETWRSPERVFTITSQAAASVKLHTFWFPGWTVRVNGEAVEAGFDPADGAIQFQVPAGESHVTATFENTPVRNAGVAISAGSLLVVVALLAFSVISQRRAAALTPARESV